MVLAPQTTIFALSSGQPPAGIAIVRLSGPAAFGAAAALGCGTLTPRLARRVRLRHPRSAEPLDEALALGFPAPASFTGEDVVELHLHGGRAVVAAVLAALAELEGLRLAEPGAFARRAFDNGRIDLTEAEALADLIAAETEGQRRIALANAGGRLRRQADVWRGDLLEAMALLEALIDFAEEDVGIAPARAAAEARVRVVRDSIAAALADAHRGEIHREGFRVVLAGPPNVGKSSLLNVLARRDVAIVSAEPGTTRDAIEVRLDLAGLAVVVTDTAGLREASGDVEAEGIRRSYAHAAVADLVLWLVDVAEPDPRVPDRLASLGVPVVAIVTKSDLLCGVRPVPGLAPDALRVSARRGTGIGELERLIARHASQAAGDTESLLVVRARERQCLEQTLAAIEEFLDPSEQELALGAEALRRANHALGRLAGSIGVEEVLGAIFARFCI
ncbi:MAG: tRNA uridine-5-carboxymethylaminomethyl(34) synthesis GTPase MnmE, partial [Hyphomicrobiaceae bacterium]